MESMVMMNRAFWIGKRVFITGHTGFKGGWLSLWLQYLGAHVYGYSLDPPSDPNLFVAANIRENMQNSTIGDIRDLSALKHALHNAKPDIVFHLAAQSLVRRSYREPKETFEINVLGTIHLYEAVRYYSGHCAIVNVTSDKCYENREWVWGYREKDAMGGYDPYSCSKGCAELLTNAWRRSFFNNEQIALASARAGNVIGGGDWAEDRLIPDFFRSIDSMHTLHVRSPNAIRPWQHVLEPLSGYLILSEKLYNDGASFAEAWNFGPSDDSFRPVRWIIDRLASAFPEANWKSDSMPQPHEANCLKLDSSKARSRLYWRPRWNLETSLNKTIEWHLNWRQNKDMQKFTLSQIIDYMETAKGA